MSDEDEVTQDKEQELSTSLADDDWIVLFAGENDALTMEGAVADANIPLMDILLSRNIPLPVDIVEKACLAGSPDMLAWLATKGYSMTSKTHDDPYAGLPIVNAAALPDMRVLKWLIEVGGAKVDDRGEDGITPLVMAASENLVPNIEYLIGAGASIDGDPNCDMSSPIGMAVAGGSFDAAKALLDAGASIAVTDENGACLMSEAASFGRLSVMKLLRRMGMSIGRHDDYGMTPLMIAVWYGHLHTVKWLLSEGASVQTIDAKGRDVWKIIDNPAYEFPDVADFLRRLRSPA